MDKRRSRAKSPLSFAVESLEGRMVLSTMGAAGAVHHGAVEVAAQTLKNASTQTSLAVKAGTLGQPITFNVTVRAAASAGSPQGTVSIMDHGQVIDMVTLSPSTTTGKYAFSSGTATLTQQPGGSAYYFGKHAISATFIPDGSFAKSTANKVFTVGQPSYTTLAGGVQVANIIPGTGPAIQSQQTANVLYTGYLATNGQIFDDSTKDGGTPFSFAVGAGEVIPGFDAGTLGMQVGETRIIKIPPAEGYGNMSEGSIPPNSTLIFVMTLESIT